MNMCICVEKMDKISNNVLPDRSLTDPYSVVSKRLCVSAMTCTAGTFIKTPPGHSERTTFPQKAERATLFLLKSRVSVHNDGPPCARSHKRRLLTLMCNYSFQSVRRLTSKKKLKKNKKKRLSTVCATMYRWIKFAMLSFTRFERKCVHAYIRSVTTSWFINQYRFFFLCTNTSFESFDWGSNNSEMA